MTQSHYLLKQAWASLKNKPGFVITVVTSMGTTLGALLCVLSLAYLLLLKPLPYPDSEDLYKVVHVMGDAAGEHDTEWFTYPGLMHLYNNQDVFSETALLNYRQEVLTSEVHQPVLYTTYSTPQWFALLDAKVHLGRLFAASENVNTFNPVAVLSYATWQNEFSADPEILEKKVTIRGVSYSVVGVLSADFVEPHIQNKGADTGVWLPWDFNAEVRFKDLWYGITELVFVGKLKPGLAAHSVEQSLTPLVNNKWQQNVAAMPFFKGWSINIQLRSFKAVVLGDISHTLLILFLSVLGLVIIASANIANLFVSRTAEQRHNLAIRSALGANRSQLFYHLVAETGLLMVLAILLGLVVSSVGFYCLQHFFALVFPRVAELKLNLITFAVACLLVLGFSLFFAFLCSRIIQYRRLVTNMQSSGKGNSVQVSKGMRQVLIVAQVSVAAVLIFANLAMFKQAFESIHKANDLALQNLTHLRLAPATATTPSGAEVVSSMQHIRQQLEKLAQVEVVAQSSSGLDYFNKWALTDLVNNARYVANSKEIDQHYLDLYGQPLLEGRWFSKADIVDGTDVLIVNQTFAKKINPAGSALGRRFAADGRKPAVVIGVVQDFEMPAAPKAAIRVYRPTSAYLMEMTVKTIGQQTLLRQEVIALLEQHSPEYALLDFETLLTSKYKLLFVQYVTALTSLVVALLTLFLAGLGLYGILSYSAQIRRFELGTRLAIGAKGKDLVKLIFTDNLSMILLGGLTSLVLILSSYIFYRDFFIQVVGKSLLTPLLLTFLIIISLCLFACYWPLRQYIKQPVINTLRSSQ